MFDEDDAGGGTPAPQPTTPAPAAAPAPVAVAAVAQPSPPTPAPAPAQPTAESKNTDKGKDSEAEPRIPLSRFNEVNNALKEMKQKWDEREAKEREAEEARIAAEREAEEQNAKTVDEARRLAEKRERELIQTKERMSKLRDDLIRERETAVAQTTQEHEQSVTQLRVQFEQERAALTVAKDTADRELARVQTELQAATERAQRLAQMLSEGLDAEINEWPDEVKALDPGADHLEARQEYVAKSRALVTRLQGARPVPGNGTGPKPETGTAPTHEGERDRLRNTGMYSL
jgi:chromosome segregation ATPase